MLIIYIYIYELLYCEHHVILLQIWGCLPQMFSFLQMSKKDIIRCKVIIYVNKYYIFGHAYWLFYLNNFLKSFLETIV